MVYCSVCGRWAYAKTYASALTIHQHRGISDYYMKAQPINWMCGADLLAVRKIRSKSKWQPARWRLYSVEIISGYTDRPAWGHEAGHCIHYEYRAYRDGFGNMIQADSPEALMLMVEKMPGAKPGNELYDTPEAIRAKLNRFPEISL